MDSKDWVLIVGGSILQWPAVRAAHELGYKVLLTDCNPQCYCAGLVEQFINLSTFDIEGHVGLARDWRDKLAAVFTAGADPIVTVARAAQEIGCHGIDPEIAERCANKYKTRIWLYDYGVSQPGFKKVCDGYRMIDAMREIATDKDKLIVKSPSSSGSRGHTVASFNEFRDMRFRDRAYARAVKYSPDRNVLMERWLDGKVLSVETLWYNGTMIPLNAVDRPFDGIIELGHFNPLVADTETYTAIWDVMEQAGSAIGMGETQGGYILKGDLIITDEGPKVLELTTRLSGGFDSGWTSPLARGVDYTKGSLILALGRPLEEAMPYFTPRWRKHAACMAAFGPKEGGIIKEIRTEVAEQICDEVIVTYKPGDVLPPLVDCTQRVAYCISWSGDPSLCYWEADYAANSIEVICE